MINKEKRLKCDKCDIVVDAINKLNDSRYYCPKCGRNLGCYEVK